MKKKKTIPKHKHSVTVAYNDADRDSYCYLNTGEPRGPENSRECPSSHTEPETALLFVLFCFNQGPLTWWLKPQAFIFSPHWRPDALDQGIRGADVSQGLSLAGRWLWSPCVSLGLLLHRCSHRLFLQRL